MPDPESEREGLSQCLGTINAIGDVFTLGVSLPDFEDVISGMQGGRFIYPAAVINEVHNQVLFQRGQ